MACSRISLLLASLSCWLVIFNFANFKTEKKELKSSTTVSKELKSSTVVSYNLAQEESFGFFDDISNVDWKRLQQRARSEVFFEPTKKEIGVDDIRRLSNWMKENVHPMFTCLHIRRVGGLGDGAKWVCDPHRLRDISDCLVYSVGSKGNFDFEYGLNDLFSKHCEIHVFDPDPSYAQEEDAESRNIHYHPWGLTSSSSSEYSRKNRGNSTFKSLQNIVKELGHESRRIDVLKIDCEGCEWVAVNDWFDPRLDIRQILVEIHPHHLKVGNANVKVGEFFENLFDHGFIPFSKEANPNENVGGTLYEYSFIRLAPSFFKNSKKGL